MPFNFALIPEHLRISTVQKLEFRDFVNFHESSRLSCNTGNKIKTSFVLPVENIECMNERFLNRKIKGSCSLAKFLEKESILSGVPVRFLGNKITVHGALTEALNKRLTTLLNNTNSSFSQLQIDTIECPPGQLDKLLEASKAHTFKCAFISSTCFLATSHSQLYDLHLHECPLTDADLMSLKSARLYLGETNISSSGVNLILKEWLNGERSIVNFTVITTNKPFDENSIFEGIWSSVVDKKNSWNECYYTIKKKEDFRIIVTLYTCVYKVTMAE